MTAIYFDSRWKDPLFWTDWLIGIAFLVLSSLHIHHIEKPSLELATIRAVVLHLKGKLSEKKLESQLTEMRQQLEAVPGQIREEIAAQVPAIVKAHLSELSRVQEGQGISAQMIEAAQISAVNTSPNLQMLRNQMFRNPHMFSETMV